MNRLKRKRKHRQTKRIEYLEKMMRRWDLWSKITCWYKMSESDAFALWDRFKEYDTIYWECFESVCQQGQDEKYLLDLIYNYYKPKYTGISSLVGIRYGQGFDAKHLKEIIESHKLFPSSDFFSDKRPAYQQYKG